MNQDTADNPAIRRPVPRLYHKKSRLGCLRCKGRRVKCDERRPVCSGCARHGVECVYPTETAGSAERVAPKRKRAAESSGYAANATGNAGADGEEDAETIPESRGRRMTELRLLHHYIMTQSRTFGHTLGVPSPDGHVWSSNLVRQALEEEEDAEPSGADADPNETTEKTEKNEKTEKHDGILFALLAHAALSVWMGTDTTASAERRAQHRRLHQQYLSMALRAQRRAVDALVAVSAQPNNSEEATKATRVLADHVGSAALLLVNHSFALVQTLPVEPWQPPHEWLQMGRGAMQVMEVAQAYLGLGAGTGPDGSTPAAAAPTRTSISREAAARARARAAPALPGSASPPPFSLTSSSSSSATPPPPLPPPSSLVLRVVQTAPFFDPSEIFAPVWAAPFLWLLDEPSEPPRPDEPESDERHHYQERDQGQGQGQDQDQDRSVPGLYNPDRTKHAASSDAMRVYYETLAYIGWCAAAAERRDETVSAICRRLAAAAYWFPQELEERLEERRPRALVCLAQYFALWIPFEFTGSFAPSSSSSASPPHRPVWMVGTAGRRQVAAIHAALPTRWKRKIAPLLGQVSVVT